MSEINDMGACKDFSCKTYDLCEVVFQSEKEGFNDRIICEGFKFSGKLNAEAKKNSACYEGYGWKLSNIEWEWELTAPCETDFFDKRFKNQLCNKGGLTLTAYVLDGCGDDDWKPMESLTHCIITEIGREYGEGTTRTIKGVALHHKIFDGSRSRNGWNLKLPNPILASPIVYGNPITASWAMGEVSEYISSITSSGGGGGGAF